MYTTRQYQSEINVNNLWQKYDSPENLERILLFLVESSWLPSQVTVERAIKHLKLARTDGRTDRDDARDIRDAAQRSYDAAAKEADRIPLTREELDHFASMSREELARKYWGEDGQASDYFSIRYRKGSREFGFVIPPKPKAVPA